MAPYTPSNIRKKILILKQVLFISLEMERDGEDPTLLVGFYVGVKKIRVTYIQIYIYIYIYIFIREGKDYI